MAASAARRGIASVAAAALGASLLVAGCGAGAAPSKPAPAASQSAAPVPQHGGAAAAQGGASAASAQPPATRPAVQAHVEPLRSSSPPYTATLHVPALKWPGHAKRAAKVNAAIQSWVDARVAAFTKGVQRDLAGAHNLPKSLPESRLTLTFHTALVDGRLASFAFVEQPYYRGAANAAQEPLGLTFDLATGRRLALSGLFRGGADYLGALSRLATAGLSSFHPAGARCYLGKGPAAAAGDFGAWWLSPAGLVLSFPAGQYTAAYCGPPKVTLSAAKLASIARPGGPLGGSAG